jgi:hypothetical protein
MQGEGFLLTIAQAPSYIPGGGRSFWKLIGFLLLVIGFLIADCDGLLRRLQRRFAENDMHAYEVRPHKDRRGVDLISDALPFGRLWYGEPNAVSNAIGNAKFYSRSHHAVIRVYDTAGNVIENARARGRVQRVMSFVRASPSPSS